MVADYTKNPTLSLCERICHECGRSGYTFEQTVTLLASLESPVSLSPPPQGHG